jgi:hypothetical protein
MANSLDKSLLPQASHRGCRAIIASFTVKTSWEVNSPEPHDDWSRVPVMEDGEIEKENF